MLPIYFIWVKFVWVVAGPETVLLVVSAEPEAVLTEHWWSLNPESPSLIQMEVLAASR